MQEEAQKVLTFTIEREGESALVKCQGRLIAATAPEFHQALRLLLSQVKLITIDLAELTYVDSAGLGTLVRLRISARKSGCAFRLLHLGKQLRNVLKLTNLLSVFGEAEDHGINIA